MITCLGWNNYSLLSRTMWTSDKGKLQWPQQATCSEHRSLVSVATKVGVATNSSLHWARSLLVTTLHPGCRVVPRKAASLHYTCCLGPMWGQHIGWRCAKGFLLPRRSVPVPLGKQYPVFPLSISSHYLFPLQTAASTPILRVAAVSAFHDLSFYDSHLCPVVLV